MSELQVIPDRQSHTAARINWNGHWEPALTDKLRVLLHAAPLIELQQSDSRRDQDLRYYDALTLAVKVFDIVIENMGLDVEASRDSVTRALEPLLASMDQAAELAPDRQRHHEMISRVLAALRNENDRRLPFSVSYQAFDESGAAVERRLEFRLVSDHFHPSGGTVLRLSNEAVNLFLRAIDLDIEDAQAAAEAVVESQLARGKFEDAVQSARNARLQSVRFEEKITRILQDTRRDVRRVDWAQQTPQLLDQALTHIGARLNTEQNILEVARERLQLMNPDNEKFRAVAEVQRLVEECRGRHVGLHRQLMLARNVFLDEQERQSFSAAPPGHLPSLIADVLEPLLSQPVCEAFPLLAATVPALTGPQLPILLSLPELVEWQLRPRRALGLGEIPVEDLDLTSGTEEHFHYPESVRDQADGFLHQFDQPTTLSAILAAALDQEFPLSVRECLVLTVLKQFGPEEGAPTPFSVRKSEDHRLNAVGFVGDEFELTPLEAS